MGVQMGVHLGVYLGVYLGVSSNSPPGIYKLFTTGKSHAPAHIRYYVQILGYGYFCHPRAWLHRAAKRDRIPPSFSSFSKSLKQIESQLIGQARLISLPLYFSLLNHWQNGETPPNFQTSMHIWRYVVKKMNILEDDKV